MTENKRKRRGTAKRFLIWASVTIGQAGLLCLTALFVWAIQSRGMPDLHFWHQPVLTAEFTAEMATPQTTLNDYLDQEQRLFDELQKKVYNRVEPSDGLTYSR